MHHAYLIRNNKTSIPVQHSFLFFHNTNNNLLTKTIYLPKHTQKCSKSKYSKKCITHKSMLHRTHVRRTFNNLKIECYIVHNSHASRMLVKNHKTSLQVQHSFLFPHNTINNVPQKTYLIQIFLKSTHKHKIKFNFLFNISNKHR